MGLIRLIGDGPPAPATVMASVEDAVAAVLPRHASAFRVELQREEAAPNLACDTAEPVLHIYLNAAPAPGAACHVRLGIVGPGMPKVEVLTALALASGAEAVDSVYQWPGNGVDSALEAHTDAAFAQWLALGMALAQARHAAAAGRRHLADELLDSQRRLAKEIHGGAMQELVAATFLLGLIPAGAGEPVLAQIQSALSHLRDLGQRLNPPALADFGLVAALRTGIRSYQRMSTAHSTDHSAAARAAGEAVADGEVVFPVEFSADLPELSPRAARTLYWICDRLLATLITDAPPATITRIGLTEEAPGVMLQVAWVADEKVELPTALAVLFHEMVAAVDGRMAYHNSGAGVSSLQVWMPVPA